MVWVKSENVEVVFMPPPRISPYHQTKNQANSIKRGWSTDGGKTWDTHKLINVNQRGLNIVCYSKGTIIAYPLIPLIKRK